mgnify:FL=1
MRELKIGERIPIEAGGEAVVSRELGRGGQGIVYLVRYNGREYALKWYFISRIKNPEAFRNNLRKNIEDGAPEGGLGAHQAARALDVIVEGPGHRRHQPDGADIL